MRGNVRLFSLFALFVCALLLAAATAVIGAAPAWAAVDSGASPACGDSTPPVTTCDYDGLWHNAPATLHFSATDSGSGVAYTEYSTDGCTWVRGTSVKVSAMGVIPVRYNSVDNSGNVETVHTVNVDMLGVALYAGADSSMSGTFKVASALVNSQPSAALYVNGKLTTGTSVNLSTVKQYVKANGATVPPITQFMPDARVATLTQAAQAAQKTGTVYNGLSLSGSQNASYSTPITVNGNLTISGSGTYTFNSVYVTGNVSITSSSAKFSFTSLYVGGTLSVTGSTAVSWGPTYVAGDTTLSGSGQWNVSLFVTAGNLTISGSQTMAGDGVGSDAKPATTLMTGMGKTLTISGSGKYYGLLCDRNGGVSVTSSAAAINGSLLCGGAFSATGGSTITWNSSVATPTMDVSNPTTTATTSPAANANGWNNAPVTVTLLAQDDAGGSGVASTSYTIDAGATQTYTAGKPFAVSGDAAHTVKYWSKDKAGNAETANTLVVNIDTTKPATASVSNPAGGAFFRGATAPSSFSGSAADNSGGAGLPTNSATFTLKNPSGRYWSGVAWQTGVCNLATTNAATTGNATTTWTSAGPLPGSSALSDGAYTVTATATDKAGNSFAGAAISFTYDSKAPVTASVTSPANSSLLRAATMPASLSGSAADNSGGVGLAANSVTVTLQNPAGLYWNSATLAWQSAACSLGASNAATTSGTTSTWTSGSILPSGNQLRDGVYTVIATAVDKAGNSFTGAAVTFTYDATAPSTSVTTPGSGAFYRATTMPSSFAGTAADATSGVASVTFTLQRSSDSQYWNGSGWGASTNLATTYSGGSWTSTAKLPTWAEGSYTFRATAADKAGNSFTGAAVTFTYDATAPSTTLSASPGTWTNGAVQITLTSGDSGGSGVATTCYQIGTTVTPYTGPFTVGYATPISYWSTDKAGNTETAKSYTPLIDTTKPTFAPTKSPSADWTNQAVAVAANASDTGGSGLSGTVSYVVKQGTQVVDSGSGDSATIDAPSPDAYQVTFATTDKAGNSATSAPVTVQIDRSAPITTASTQSQPENGWYSGDVTYMFDANDTGGSGVAETMYSIDGGTPVNDTSCKVTGGGSHTVSFWSVDNAGNQEAVTTIDLKIDETLPAVSVTNRNAGTAVYNEPVFGFSATKSGGSDLAGLQVQLAKFDDATQQWDAAQPVDGVTSGKPWPGPLPDGKYKVIVSASNTAGKVGTADCTFDVAVPPVTTQPANPVAGDVVGVYADKAWSPNGDWGVNHWNWKITYVDPSENWTSFDDPMGFVMPAVGGTYHGELTVTDDVGADATGAKCVVEKDITVGQLKPRVHALDVMAFAGRPVELVGRFLDPAWAQTHSATWHIDGIDPDPVASVNEDNFAAMDSGIVEGTTPPLNVNPGTQLQGSLTVSDDNGGPSTTVPFKITVRADSTTAGEGSSSEGDNKITTDTPKIESNGEILQSYIQSSGDVDIFEVAKTDGTALDAGTQVLVTLRDLPADYDVAVIQDYTNQPEYAIPKLGGTSFLTGGTVASDVAGIKYASGGGIKYASGGGIKYASGGGIKYASGGGIKYVSGGGIKYGSGGGIKYASGGGIKYVSGGGIKYASGGGIKYGSGGGIKYASGGGIKYGSGGGIRSPIDPASFGAWTSDLTVLEGQWLSNTIGIGAGRCASEGPDDAEPFLRSPDLCPLYTQLTSAQGASDTDQLDGFPFSDMSFTELDDDTTSGGDVTFDELGFSHDETLNRTITDYSAASGTQDEVVLATVETVNGHTYIAVKGANGAYSATTPYTLQVETTPELNYSKLLNQGKQESPLVTADTTQQIDNPGNVSDPQTLYVTQPQRLDALYGAGAWSKVRTALEAACDPATDGDSAGTGVILELPSSIYDDWDVTPWDTDLANGVTDGVRSAIDDYIYGGSSGSQGHPSIRYVVLAGDDEVVPFRRMLDQTVLDNERLYADESSLDLTSPLESGLYGSQMLTDDFYADRTPVPYNSGWLYVPELAVSRLVETPNEIAGTVAKFLSDGGLLGGSSVVTGQRSSSVVTGQDFMDAGAQRISDILSAAGLTPKLESLDKWKLADLRTDLSSPGSDIVSLNMHCTHYGGISADGYNGALAGNDSSAEFLNSSEIKTSAAFAGKLIFTMGCHAGLNVPDEQATDTSGDIDPALDVAQAMAEQRGVLVANTGYGYGDWCAIAGTVDLMGRFADQVTTSTDVQLGQPIGLALASAKRQFLDQMTAVTPYDEKCSTEMTMYGMPQYRIPCTTHTPPQASDVEWPVVKMVADDNGDLVRAPKDPTPASFPGAFPETAFTLDVAGLSVTDPSGDTPYQGNLIEPATDTQVGAATQTERYITVDGDSESVTDRPTQPRMVVDLGPAGDTPVTGAVVTGGNYEDLQGFDPAVTSEAGVDGGTMVESQAHADGWWPASPVTVTTVDTSGGPVQYLIVTPGQFQATDIGDHGVTGTERVWTRLKIALVHADYTNAPGSHDTLGPTANSVGLSNVGPLWTATVDATDESGISRIDVTQIGADSAHVFTQSFTPDPNRTTPYTVTFSPNAAAADVAVMVAVYDGVGNVTTMTAKGHLVTGPPTGSMTLNHGAATTYSRLVMLDSSHVVNATDLRVSFDGGTHWMDWVPFATRFMVTLPAHPGPTNVMVQYRNEQPAVLTLSAAVNLRSAPMAAGSYSSYATGTSGVLSVWGFGAYGRLGDGNVNSHSQLSPLPLTGTWAQVSAGGTHVLAIKPDGTLWAWGMNDSGELGDTTTTDHATPEQIDTAHDWVAVSAGMFFSLALKSDGSLWAWGWGAYGELGYGGEDDQTSPVRIGTDNDWAAISAGGNFSLALKDDGSLWAWGFNAAGQLGDGTTTYRYTPERIGSANDWGAVSAAEGCSHALKADGSLWSWGDNTNGELGDGTITQHVSPEQIGTATDWVAISASWLHTLALKADGTMWAWGWDDHGQLGNGTTGTSNSPVQVGTGHDWAAIAAGSEHSLALTADGSLYAAGDNEYGQLGDGSKNDSTSFELVTSHLVDITAPTVAITSPSDGSTVTTATPQLTFDTGDAVPVSVVVRVDGAVVGTTSGQNLAALANGQHTVTVTGTDAAGNTGSASSTFTVSTVAPIAPVVTSPNGGESWIVGSSHTITWTPGNGGPVNVEVSRDGGVHWEMIAYSTPDDGSQLWSVDGPATSQALVRVTSSSGSDVSDAAFTIVAAIAPTVTSPNGGESWPMGSSQTITWTPGNGGPVTIELSRDNGGNWETLFASTVNDGSQSWTVSGPATSQALVRTSNSSGSDVSNAGFTIGAGFATHVDYASGSHPNDVAFGDFNGDGRRDMAAADAGANTVSVMLGNGDGTFLSKVDYATGTSPFGVAVADFNGDGKQDLVTANFGASTVSVLLGNGDGTFQAKVDYAIGSTARSVAVADLNSDGKLDLVTADEVTNTVSVLLGNGDGTFQAKVDYATGSAPLAVAIADVNRDGKQDLVTADYNSSAVSVLLGNGNGTFQPKVDYATGGDPYAVAVGDFNSDGKLDLVAANSNTSTVSVLLGNGDGTFQANVDYFTGPTSESVSVADLNGDGKQDLAVTLGGGPHVYVLAGNGDGTFQTRVSYAIGVGPAMVSVADLNGDGRNDLVTADYQSDAVSVLISVPASPPGSAQFATHVDSATGTGTGPRGCAVGDFNADGRQDEAVANYSANTVGIFLGNGNGTFQTQVTYGTGNGPRAVGVADVNHDGRQDLVTANWSDTVSVLLGNGDGTFQAKVDYPTGSGNYNPNSVAIADLDRDGWLDIAAGDYGGMAFCVLKGLSGGTFPSMGMGISIGSPQSSVAVADVNRDGKPDAVTADYATNKVSVRLGNGDTTFLARVDYGVFTDPEDVAVADLNGDGKPDLLVANYGANTLSVLLGNGDGTFQAKVDYPTGAGPRAIAIADLNSDGKLDIVTADDTAGSVSVLAGNGDGTLRASVDCAVGANPYDVTVADINGDGRPDLVTANSGANTTSVLLNTTLP